MMAKVYSPDLSSYYIGCELHVRKWENLKNRAYNSIHIERYFE